MNDKLIPCPDCKQTVSKRAEACPHCGAPIAKFLEYRRKRLSNEGQAKPTGKVDTKKYEDDGRNILVGIIAAAVIGFGVYSYVKRSGGESSASDPEPEVTKSVSKPSPSDGLPAGEIKANVICQNFVEERLKSPKSADFPWGVKGKKLGKNYYRVVSYVDVTNSYGAELRKYYECNVKYKSGDWADNANWELVSLRFE